MQEGGCFWGDLLQRVGLQGRSRHGLFVELLLFSALAIGGVAAALLRSINVRPAYPVRGAGSRCTNSQICGLVLALVVGFRASQVGSACSGPVSAARALQQANQPLQDMKRLDSNLFVKRILPSESVCSS